MWKVLNSGIFIWLLSTLVGTFGAIALKQEIDSDSRISQLQNRASQIDLEIEGRLAQFSSWAVGIVERQNNTDGSWTYRFRGCVTPFYLSRALRAFGDPPNAFGQAQTRTEPYGFADTNCSTTPIIRSVFDDYASTLLSGLFAQRIIVERDLIKAIQSDFWVDRKLLAEQQAILKLHEHVWEESMSPLIDPTAPAGFNLSPERTVTYSEFAKRMQTLFYEKRGGPNVFYYGDCFLC